MKSQIVFVGILLFLFLAVPAAAGDISGKWFAPMEGVYVEMNFKVEGTTLTGTMDNPRSGKTKIRDGRIDGDSITFYVVRKLGQEEMKVLWQGSVVGDEIEFTRMIGGGRGIKVIAKREKTGLPGEKGRPADKSKRAVTI